MKPTRGSILAGLVLVAIAAPLTAYAVAGDDSDPAPPVGTHGPNHPKPSKGPEAEETPGTEDDTGTEHADEASAPGRAHADAMKAWAHCVADAASGPKAEGSPIPPKDACGDKPVSPGRAKHAPASEASPGRSGGHRSDHGHGHGH
jgi:hypothetical protein